MSKGSTSNRMSIEESIIGHFSILYTGTPEGRSVVQSDDVRV